MREHPPTFFFDRAPNARKQRMSVAVSYRLISQNLERQLELTASRGPVKLETEYYRENFSKIETIDDFLDDTRVFRYAMTAFGLADLAYAKGYIRKVLEGGILDPRSLANRTDDGRILEFARTFDFDTFGETTMQRAATGSGLIDRYVRQTLETEAGLENEGVRLALYFERAGANLESGLEALADPALAKVIRTALGLPNEFGAADIDRQAAVIEDRIDLASLSDPEEMERFLTRFAALYDATNTPANDPVLSLFGVGSASSQTISIELAMTFSSLRLGGN